MHKYNKHLSLVVSCLLVIFAATACFQTAGDSLEDSGVVQDFVTLTPVPFEENPQAATEEPTFDAGPELPLDATEEVAIPFPTETETTIPLFEEATAEQPTPEAPTQGAGDQGLFATSTPMANLSVPNQDALDDSAMTATAIIFEATLRAEQSITETAQAGLDQGGGGVIFPTETPFVFEPTIDAGQGGGFATQVPFQPTLAYPPGYVQGQDCIHEVRPGDNLFRLSLYYGIPIQDIATRNGIVNIQIIIVGQKLVIPGCGTTGNPPPPTSVPGTYPPYPGPGTGNGQIYIVQQYDNLFRISLRYGVSIQAIAAANGIYNINLIYIGQQLVIP